MSSSSTGKAVNRDPSSMGVANHSPRAKSLEAQFKKDFGATDDFEARHIGPREKSQKKMLEALGFKSIDELIDKAIPSTIRTSKPFSLPTALSEAEFLNKARIVADKNEVFRSFIGLGYHNCHTPSVILRNVIENPGWYTAYTPYQAEISQGRMEALLNFQTVVCDLTGMDIANASLLDEGTAAAEAMIMAYNSQRKRVSDKFFVSEKCFPQTRELLQTRSEPYGIELVYGDPSSFDFAAEPVFGAIVQYPNIDGELNDLRQFISSVKSAGGMSIVATDLMSLCLVTSPGEMGADVVIGNSQRLGVPLGFGGPHAAFFATTDKHKRSVPGRFIGISKDTAGDPALRLALQTREQHIRREKATSNICTSQVLLAVMASMYAVYHGPKGLKAISSRIHNYARLFSLIVEKLGHKVLSGTFFDTVTFELSGLSLEEARKRCLDRRINLRWIGPDKASIAFNETSSLEDIKDFVEIFSAESISEDDAWRLVEDLAARSHEKNILGGFERTSEYLTHPTFNSYHSETEMMRYLNRLQSRDISLVHSMIPLGSCTMKLNAATEMIPVTWPEFNSLHPFIPSEQFAGYSQLFEELQTWLCDLCGFDAFTLQPNAGSQGEYAGLMVIRKYHQARGDHDRNICIIPSSAHGTNPASAVMAGMKVVVVKCDDDGNIDMDDLRTKATENAANLAALMVTYPSTHGVFEETIREICDVIHSNGGQVYMDGANMNALLGLCRPGEFGPDVAHLNLHKTFCIPHGGGGPGMGPIGVMSHLAPYLPTHSLMPECGPTTGSTAISAAPWGSPSILPISWAYIAMMGSEGLRQATEVAILNANYIAHRLKDHYPILYKGSNGLVAHECIIDTRGFKDFGVTVDDIAKRLMDYGFHAPTMSWPVAGTLMIEPTESESLAELDRFCEAMISIREEIREVEGGKISAEESVLRNAPHTQKAIVSDDWSHKYSREKAAFPLSYLKDFKVWPAVGRVDNAHGDKNFICSCLPLSEYQ